MQLILTLVILLFVLVSPAQAADPVVGTTYTASSLVDQTSYTFADFTVTTPTANSVLLVSTMVRGNTSPDDSANTSCAIGGVTAVSVNVRGAENKIRHAHILRANFPGGGAAGAYSVVCSTTGNALDEVIVAITQVDGLAQQVPEATTGSAVATGTSESNNITTVTASAFVWDGMFTGSANPGTVTAGANQTILSNLFPSGGNRHKWSSYEIGPVTPGTVTMSVSWVNSISFGEAIVSAYKIADAGRPSITVIQPFPPIVPPPATLTIDNASPLPGATETVAYSVAPFTASGGTDPKTFRVNPNSGDLNTWNAGTGALNFSETFSEPAPCSLVETWVSTTGFTVVTTSPLGTRCVGAKASSATNPIAKSGLTSNRLAIKGRDFHRTGSSSNAVALIFDAGGAILGFLRVTSAGLVDVVATGGTSAVITTVAADSTFDWELDCTRDGTISCTGYVNALPGATSNGTSTAVMDRWGLGLGPTSPDIQYYGRIDACLTGRVDIACAATNTWVRTGTPEPNNVFINGVELLATEWSWESAASGTLTVSWPTDPDADLVETGKLPTGLTLASNGTLSGTPAVGTAAGSPYLFTIRAIDPNLLTGSKEFSLTIVTAPAPPPTDPEPWVDAFTAVRTHYVDDIACGGVGTIGDPECMSTAMNNTHYACGDLHIFRAGTYDLPTIFGITDTAYYNLTKDCTESAPVVWKGYVDSTTGQPENAYWTRAHFQLQGAWHWFVNIHVSDLTTGQTGTMIFNSNDGGQHFINNVTRDTQTGQYNRFGANPDGPGYIVYGNVAYNPGCGNTSPNLAQIIYVQNDYSLHGYKYYVQNIVLETKRNAVPPCGLYLWQSYASSNQAAFPVSGFHLQDNLFGDAPNSGALVIGHDANIPSTDNVIFRNYFSDFYLDQNINDGLQLGRNNPLVGTITYNYFAKTAVTPLGYWGATDSHAAFSFQNNEVYNPSGGNHIAKFQTRATTGSVGSHKIPNQDVWNNNTYGGTFKAHLKCNGTDYGTALTFAQWKTNTSDCRVTPGTGFDINSTNPANPTVNKIVVLQNEYQCPTCTFTDQDRGNIYIINWENAASDIVDISSVVGPNKTYTVRYARDFFGTAAASGTCPGSGACNVTLNLRRTNGEPTTKFTNAYVITAQP